MKTRRIMAVVLAALMMLSIIPVAFAEEISSISADAALSVRMDDAWAAIELAEAEALADNLPASDVINAVTPLLSTTKMLMRQLFRFYRRRFLLYRQLEWHCATTTGSATKLNNGNRRRFRTFNASNGQSR